MAFRPNYRFERNERNLAKQAKKEEKLRRRQERNRSVMGRSSRRPMSPRHRSLEGVHLRNPSVWGVG